MNQLCNQINSTDTTHIQNLVPFLVIVSKNSFMVLNIERYFSYQKNCWQIFKNPFFPGEQPNENREHNFDILEILFSPF